MWLLIKADFYRYTRGKKWIGLFATLLVISITSIATYYYIPLLLDSLAVSNTEEPLDIETIQEGETIRREVQEANAPTFLKVTGGNTFWVVLLVIFVSINFLVEDFNARIHKNNLSFGISRKQIYLGKYFFGLLAITIITTFYHFSSLIINCLLFNITDSFFDYFSRTVQVILMQLPLFFAIYAVCFGFVYLLKSKLKIYGIIFGGSLILILIQMKLAKFFPDALPMINRFKIFSSIGKIGSWENHSLDRYALNLIIFALYSLVFLTLGWIGFKNYNLEK
nr:ABC transporter permease [Carnobacterium maltaromaticum]